MRPLILAGHGVRLAGLADRFLPWAESLGIPVVTTWNAMDLIPYNHPLCIGRPGVVALRAPNFAVQNCDLLIVMGCRLDPIVTAFNPSGFAPCAKRIVADIDHPIEDLMDSFYEQGNPEWLKKCQGWKTKYPPERNSHYDFVSWLSDAVPEDAIIVTGSSGLAVEAFYQTFRNKKQRIFLTAGLGAMGYGLPAAIGAAFASGKPVICLEGDGSFQLNMQELSTVMEHNLPISIIIMNNGGYASIRTTQRNYFDSRFVGTHPWLPSLEDIAATYGLPYRNSLSKKPPVIIEVILNPDDTLSPKVAAIRKDGSMVSMPLEDMTPLLPIEELEKEMISVNPVSYAIRESPSSNTPKSSPDAPDG